MATSPNPPADFEPVPLRSRHDGWTAERQIAFIEKLADCGSITAAARHVGMSRESVRKLRRRPEARAFRDACDAALDCGYAEVEESAMERAKSGVARPVFYKGEQVGEWRHFDEHLTRFLLRFRRRHRFGAGVDVPSDPPVNLFTFDPAKALPFDPEEELDRCLQELDAEREFSGEDEGDSPGPADDEE
jgi:hypothetical protein